MRPGEVKKVISSQPATVSMATIIDGHVCLGEHVW